LKALRDKTISGSHASSSELLIGDGKSFFWAKLETIVRAEFKKLKEYIAEDDSGKKIARISRQLISEKSILSILRIDKGTSNLTIIGEDDGIAGRYKIDDTERKRHPADTYLRHLI
jgi:hypothetical protein